MHTNVSGCQASFSVHVTALASLLGVPYPRGGDSLGRILCTRGMNWTVAPQCG